MGGTKGGFADLSQRGLLTSRKGPSPSLQPGWHLARMICDLWEWKDGRHPELFTEVGMEDSDGQ